MSRRHMQKKSVMVNGIELTPIMWHGNIPIFEYGDLLRIPKFTRLTKWLSMTEDEMEYLTSEVERISSDPQRQCVIGYSLGKVTLYVNDVTNGVFDSLSVIGDE